jgi:hypothetical protein
MHLADGCITHSHVPHSYQNRVSVIAAANLLQLPDACKGFRSAKVHQLVTEPRHAMGIVFDAAADAELFVGGTGYCCTAA